MAKRRTHKRAVRFTQCKSSRSMIGGLSIMERIKKAIAHPKSTCCHSLKDCPCKRDAYDRGGTFEGYTKDIVGFEKWLTDTVVSAVSIL